MSQRSTVLPAIEPLDEADFHAAMVECIARQVSKHGHSKVAKTMCLTNKGLSNIMAGAFPRPDRLANLRTLDPDALDPIHRAYGERAVPRNAVCNTDPISAKMAAVLSKTIEMERPDSDGGQSATLAEILSLCGDADDEAALRKIARVTAGWLEMVDSYRNGRTSNVKAIRA
ncbi:hypothetical protein [Novosphingobium sp. M1R2S20]|uniref:YdaS antitoxin of YdaST toxin-antitoxin system n=1 Tax=Novosphingobium rhizovicinum TaxID=3228928 RepID=A0ABV3RCT6_9SPHN